MHKGTTLKEDLEVAEVDMALSGKVELVADTTLQVTVEI